MNPPPRMVRRLPREEMKKESLEERKAKSTNLTARLLLSFISLFFFFLIGVWIIGKAGFGFLAG